MKCPKCGRKHPPQITKPGEVCWWCEKGIKVNGTKKKGKK